MLFISRLIYDLLTRGYYSIIKLAALLNPKAKKWVEGRRHLFDELETVFAFQKTDPQAVVWFHCASLGEFEQGRTVIEALKKERPSIKILLTFFSPSGYEIRKDYPLADWVFYLPPDTKTNAQHFIKTVQPTLVVFVKYEFWYYYLNQLKKQEIPAFLIAAVFRKGQLFFKKLGILHREMLSCFKMIFVQDEKSQFLLKKINFTKIQIAGDSRIDRVLAIAGEGRNFPKIEKFCKSSPVLVCGSTWKEDEIVLRAFIDDPRFQQWKLIIAPHEVSPKRLKEVKMVMGNEAIFHSEINNYSSTPAAKILIIDSIGLLAFLYQFGKVAYIGGGLGKAIHNTLEPMAFNLPVLYGPRHTKFVEAMEMKRAGGHFPVKSIPQFLNTMTYLEDSRNLQLATKAVSIYMEQNKGASETITAHILSYL